MTEEQATRLLELMDEINEKLDRLLAVPVTPATPQPAMNETDRAFYDRLYGMYP